MVWHYFRKDVRLLWPLALAVVLTQVLCALRTSVLGYFDQPPTLERLTFFLPWLVILGIGVVAVTAVHQEPLSEAQEDWLIRPIHRRHLLWSKVLFVLLMVNVPLMLVDLGHQLILHFPVYVSIGVALSHFLLMVCAFSLPALLLGAVTRSLIDAFVFGICSALGFAFLAMIATSGLQPSLFEIGGQAGMNWISLAAAGLVMTLGVTAALAFQYRTRRTLIARGVGLAVVLAAMCTLMFLPRPVVIAAQEAVWGPQPRSEIKLNFDPARQAARGNPDTALSQGYGSAVPAAVVAAQAREVARMGSQMERIRLPLSISGLPPGEILVADRVAVRILTLTGSVLYDGAVLCTHGGQGFGIDCFANTLEVRSGVPAGSNIPAEQRLILPIAVYNRIKDEPVRLELAYVLTRFAPQPSHSIKAEGDVQSLPEMGTCATRIDNDGDEVELGCLSNVGVPSCATVVLEDPQTHKRNPELHLCRPNYAPLRRPVPADAVNRASLSIPFRDLSGLAHYPVDGAAIGRARIVVTTYDPAAHLRSAITIPSIRLIEWREPNALGGDSPASN